MLKCVIKNMWYSIISIVFEKWRILWCSITEEDFIWNRFRKICKSSLKFREKAAFAWNSDGTLKVTCRELANRKQVFVSKYASISILHFTCIGKHSRSILILHFTCTFMSDFVYLSSFACIGNYGRLFRTRWIQWWRGNDY